MSGGELLLTFRHWSGEEQPQGEKKKHCCKTTVNVVCALDLNAHNHCLC